MQSRHGKKLSLMGKGLVPGVFAIKFFRMGDLD
jgi:hypothetical protein